MPRMCLALDRDAKHGEKSKLMGKGEFPRFAPRNLWGEIPEGNYAEVTFGHTACDQRSSAPCSHVTQGKKCMTNVGTRAVAGLVIRCLAYCRPGDSKTVVGECGLSRSRRRCEREFAFVSEQCLRLAVATCAWSYGWCRDLKANERTDWLKKAKWKES